MNQTINLTRCLCMEVRSCQRMPHFNGTEKADDGFAVLVVLKLEHVH